VREQVGEVPAGTRRRLGEIVGRDGIDGFGRRQHGGPMQREDIDGDVHV
jgi:hypothetical protein